MAINIRNSGLVFYFMWEAETPTLDDILYHTNVRARQSEPSLTHAETFHHSQKGEDQDQVQKLPTKLAYNSNPMIHEPVQKSQRYLSLVALLHREGR
ncbi:hypothetical protein Pst134EB_002287 [Puccinia striiformis f. sp. tritici]|nr:hypothetical protein Pst134EB_002287 [Puccinia striiformis f. sp. tritici]